jgi:hypothetical protein
MVRPPRGSCGGGFGRAARVTVFRRAAALPPPAPPIRKTGTTMAATTQAEMIKSRPLRLRRAVRLRRSSSRRRARRSRIASCWSPGTAQAYRSAPTALVRETTPRRDSTCAICRTSAEWHLEIRRKGSPLRALAAPQSERSKGSAVCSICERKPQPLSGALNPPPPRARYAGGSSRRESYDPAGGFLPPEVKKLTQSP